MVTNTPATGSVKPFQPLGEHYGSQHPWINGNGPIYYHPNRLFVDSICQNRKSRGIDQTKTEKGSLSPPYFAIIFAEGCTPFRQRLHLRWWVKRFFSPSRMPAWAFFVLSRLKRTKEMNRSKRDSNPRYKFVIHSISNRALSATQTLLHEVFKESNKNWVLSSHYLENFYCFVLQSVYHTESLLRKSEYFPRLQESRERGFSLARSETRKESKTCLFLLPKRRSRKKRLVSFLSPKALLRTKKRDSKWIYAKRDPKGEN